ncbi:MAG TPA: GspE/PulE family protein [Acidimicrobiales bacterium]|nr:GspE/PulE family protein [Acidimicrobiales bacterium]
MLTDPLDSGATVRPARRRLGDRLLERGLVTAEELALAVEEQLATRERLGEALVRRGAITEVQLVLVLADNVGLRFVDLDDFAIDAEASRALKEHFARRLNAIGIGWDGERLLVAMANPADVFALDDIRTLVRVDVVPLMAVPSQIARAIDLVFRSGGDAEVALAAASDELRAELVVRVEARREDDEAPVIRFVNELIARAVHDGASDIHIEPTRNDLRIRFRVDGVLRDVMSVPERLRQRVVSRTKILTEMDIADRRAPQDGRASMTVDGRRVDMRAVSFPTTNGEAIVIRLLDKSGGVVDINELDFRPATLATYQRCYRQSSGAVLVTGPTGSGKSTTLYATLRDLHDPERNIITVEDPVEYELDGIKQLQVEPKAGVTFASALRSLLRADPDILLVGEIRDQDTARLTIDAALTGHLVLTSLHTKSAAATPARLVKIGVEPFLVTSAVQCVLAQRLARRLCDKCRRPTKVPDAVLARLGWTEADREGDHLGFFSPVGCNACGNAGYSGRFAIHEVMAITDRVAEAIAEWAPPPEVERVAVAEGMTTLNRDGVLKAARGLTSIEELHRIAS